MDDLRAYLFGCESMFLAFFDFADEALLDEDIWETTSSDDFRNEIMVAFYLKHFALVCLHFDLLEAVQVQRLDFIALKSVL